MRIKNERNGEQMTEKARKILDGMKRKYQLRRLSDPVIRERVLSSFNGDNTDDAQPVGGDRGMQVLEEMNEFGDQFEQHLDSLRPNINAH
jgi:uncharacterized protein YfeS